MEGGNQDKMGNPLHTLDAFYRGQVPWVGLAGDPRIPYGTPATSPQFPNVPFRIVDTGSAFKNAGLSHFDIPRDTAEGANADENNRHVQFDIGSPNFALAQGGEATDQAAPHSVAPQAPQLQTAAPGVDIGVTPTPTPIAEKPTFTFKPRSGMQTDYDMARQAAQEGAVVQLPRAVIKQDDPITQKATKAAYNTVAGFAEGMESPEGVVSILNPFVGVAAIGAVVPQLIQQVQAADKTPPGSPERWQAGANVTAFLAAPAVLHAIAKARTNLPTTNQGGIDASTSSTQSDAGIGTPLVPREGVQGQQTGVAGREGISSPAGSTRQGAQAGGKNRGQQGSVGVNRQGQQGLGGPARADRQSAADNALAESATGLPPSGSPTVEQPAPSTFDPSAGAAEAPQAQTQAGTPNFQATPAQLGVASPLPEFLNAAAQTVTTGQGALKMGRLAQAVKETVQAAMNRTFPKLTNADRLLGELAARWVSSRAAAKYLAKVFSAKVVEGLNLDPAKFGAALTEDNLRSVRAGYQAAGETEKAAQVKTLIGGPKSPFKTEAEYQAYLNEPAVKTAIARHIALWDQVIGPMYRKAMQIDDSVELPGRGLQTGARVNLFSPKDEPGAPQRNMVQGIGQGNLTGTMRRRSPFGQQATGAGRTYNTNYHDMMANTYGRQLEVANKNAFENQLVDSGHAVIANVGERPTLPDGEETTSFPLKRTGIVIKGAEGEPRPMQVNRNIYVRKRLAGEYRAAANVDLLQMPWLAKKLTGGFNHAALAGLTDATVHIQNLASALFTRPSVAGGALTDTLLSTFGRADVPVTIVKALVKSLKDNNEQLSQLAEIGALRPEFPTRNPGAKVIQWADKTTRLVLDDAYKKMVEQGLVEDTETNRREFVNQVGQYNRRAQNSFVRLGRDTGIAPFATAGTTFNALGIRTALMDPGVKATSTPAALALRANVLSKWVGGVTLVASLNYLTTGKVAGRPGVPIGNVDTGKTDENGRPLSIPVFDLLGLGRAMRVTGARGAMTAYRNGLTPGDTVDATGRDIANTQLAPWTGGPTGRILSSVLNEPFGYGLPKPNPIVPPGDSQIASNLKQAFIHSNPILASAYARSQPGVSTLDALRQQIPRLVPTPSKGADFMAKYPLIVHKAQLNAYTNDLIYRARQLAPAPQQQFLDQAFSRIPKEDWPKATKELFYRRIPYSPYSRQQAISAQ
jgi:hypothetical protein